MTSDTREAFVWIWLPGSTEPVVCGRMESQAGRVGFNYGRGYLGRQDAISIYEPELPLGAGFIEPTEGRSIAGCLDDASPDAWGKRLVMEQLLGTAARDTDPGDIDPLTYLLRSGSDRIGALDVQASPTTYVARGAEHATLDELARVAELVDAGEPLPPSLEAAILHGSSIGGARPKALLDDEGRKLIAKFSSSTDPYPVVQAEYVAMELARRADLDVAHVELATVLGRPVLLVERFDRVRQGAGWERRAVVSALTMLALDELFARYASYVDLAAMIRDRFVDARATLHELFARITFNILVGNTDDHARNHAAFWNGEALELTQAYDICPQLRSGREANQAMAFGPELRASRLADCIAAAHVYQLTPAAAREIIDSQVDAIERGWEDVCDAAELGVAQRTALWGRQFHNPYAFEDY